MYLEIKYPTDFLHIVRVQKYIAILQKIRKSETPLWNTPNQSIIV